MAMSKNDKNRIGSKGRSATDAAKDRAQRSESSAKLAMSTPRSRLCARRMDRRPHPRAALRAGSTQQEVAKRAGTSHSFISKVEGGNHIPTIPVLKRILAVLDEDLLIGIERQSPDEEPEREVAPVPKLAVA